MANLAIGKRILNMELDRKKTEIQNVFNIFNLEAVEEKIDLRILSIEQDKENFL